MGPPGLSRQLLPVSDTGTNKSDEGNINNHRHFVCGKEQWHEERLETKLKQNTKQRLNIGSSLEKNGQR